MDALLLLKSLALGIVEGLTEFLPVSSTGHLILAGHVLAFEDERAKLFMIVIQFGAILAVVVEYRRRFRDAISGIVRDPASRRFWVNLAIAFVPIAVLGLAFGKAIKSHLFNPVAVATAFIAG